MGSDAGRGPKGHSRPDVLSPAVKSQQDGVGAARSEKARKERNIFDFDGFFFSNA